jgi:hypothetical protein
MQFFSYNRKIYIYNYSILKTIEKIYISELEYLMVKVLNPDKTFTTYNLGKIKDNFSIDDLKINLTKNNN